MFTHVRLARCEDSDTDYSIVVVDVHGNLITRVYATPENLQRLGEECRKAFPSKVSALAAEGVA